MTTRFNHIGRKATTLGLTAVLASAALSPVHAGAKGRRDTAAVLSGATLYELGRGNNKTALALGLGSAYAWKRYEDARKAEKRQTSAVAARTTTTTASRPRTTSQVRHSRASKPAGNVAAAGTTARLKAENAALRSRLAALEEKTVALETRARELESEARQAALLRQLTDQSAAAQTARSRANGWMIAALAMAALGLTGLTGSVLSRRQSGTSRTTASQTPGFSAA